MSEQTAETHYVSTSINERLPYQISGEDSLKQGDYRDILSLTRVLVCGPKSKEEVDIVIDRYASEIRELVLRRFIHFILAGKLDTACFGPFTIN